MVAGSSPAILERECSSAGRALAERHSPILTLYPYIFCYRLTSPEYAHSDAGVSQLVAIQFRRDMKYLIVVLLASLAMFGCYMARPESPAPSSSPKPNLLYTVKYGDCLAITKGFYKGFVGKVLDNPRDFSFTFQYVANPKGEVVPFPLKVLGDEGLEPVTCPKSLSF